jgi:hypothetical protein
MPQGDEIAGGGSPETVDAAAIYEFNRGETPRTQTPVDAAKQSASMEIWGRSPQGGNVPTVQAYREAMRPLQGRGVKFDSNVPPTPGTGTPFEARWRLGSPGVFSPASGFAAISITRFLNLQP